MATVLVPTRPDRPVLGIALMMGFLVLAPFIEVFAKLAGAAIPVGQITAARFAVQVAIMLPLIILLGRLTAPSRRDLGLYLLRGLLILLSTAFIVAAVKVMPIADAIAIVFVEPLFLTLLGAVLLGETVGWRRVLASAIGFIGCLMVIQPSFEAFGWVALLPLGTAVCFGFYLLLTRTMTQRIDPLTMQAYTGVSALLLILPLLWLFEGSGHGVLDPVWPDRTFATYLLLGGLAATSSHIFLTYTVQMTPTSVIAPMQYLEIVTAAILGYLIFGDLFNQTAAIGATIIIGSGLYVIWREHVVSRAERQSPR